jgi:hypothetical protein
MFSLIASAIAGTSAKNALISAGASLVGGALSRRQAKKEREAHFANLRNSAIAGGFNPLSVLHATGGGGYGNYASVLSRSPLEGSLNAFSDTYIQGKRDAQVMEHELSMEASRQAHEAKLTRATNLAMQAGLPQVQENVTSVTGNPDLAVDGSGDVTSDVQFTPTETWVDSRGVTRTKPAGEDFDEQFLNSLYHAWDHGYYGAKDLWSYLTRKEVRESYNKPLNPDLPVLQPWSPLSRSKPEPLRITVQ